MVGMKPDPNREYTRKNFWVDTTTFSKYISYSQLDLLNVEAHKFYTTRNQWEIRIKDLHALYYEERNEFAETKDRYLTEQVVNAALEAKVKELVDDNLTKYNPTVLSYLSADLSNPKYVDVTYHPKVKGKPLTVKSSEMKPNNTMHLDLRWEYLDYIKGGKDMYIIPIGENQHWTLCIVKVKQKRIEFFDSQPKYKKQREIDGIFPPELDEMWAPVKKVVRETPKWRLVEQAVKKLFGIEHLTKIVHTNLPIQTDNFSCGFFLLFYAFATMKGEKLDQDKYDNKFVVTTFRRSLLKYFLEQVDDRDWCKLAPGKNGKPTSAVTVDISTEKSRDEVTVMEDQDSSDEVVIMEEVVAMDPEVNMVEPVLVSCLAKPQKCVDSEPSKHAKYVRFRCESPQYNISESEDETCYEPPVPEPEKVATMMISEPKLEVNFSRKFNLDELQSSNRILPFEDSKALEAVIKEPFVGFDEQGHKVTFNNPTKSWQNMKVFTEICVALSGTGDPRFTQQIRDILKKEIPLNPGLFAVWLKGREGGPEVISSRTDFYWANTQPYEFVRANLRDLKLGIKIPHNPLLKRKTQQRNLRLRAKEKLAKLAKQKR